MAVVIDGMNMPESCADCRFWKFNQLSPGCSAAVCLACAKVIPDVDTERPDWCPISALGGTFILQSDTVSHNPAPCTHDKEGVCPVCGGSLYYTSGVEIDDDGLVYQWQCSKCHATGREAFNRQFDCHYDVRDVRGNPIPERPE